MKNIPVYLNPATSAEANNEIEEYRESFKANIACKEAIETAIRNHYAFNCLDGDSAVREVVDQFGLARVKHVLAATVQLKDWDGRISGSNKAWAKANPTFEDKDLLFPNTDRRCLYVVDKVNPGLTDLFLTAFRREYEG